MGLRFQRRVRLMPGVRVNLSKSGLSTSLGPRGADVNVGPDGVTTNAGIPGTGLSYRAKLGRHGGRLGVLTLVAGLAFWAGKHVNAPVAPAAATAPAPISAAPAPADDAGKMDGAAATPGVRYVHRNGSVLRDEPKASGHKLKKESKGARVMLLSEEDGWAKVTDENITGWMRASVLGVAPPD